MIEEVGLVAIAGRQTQARGMHHEYHSFVKHLINYYYNVHDWTIIIMSSIIPWSQIGYHNVGST